MKKSPERSLFAALCLLTLSVVLVPPVSALPPQGPCDRWIYPYAGFTYTVHESDTFPVVVKFNSTSYSPNPTYQPIESWRWDFGDGTTDTVVRNEDPAGDIHPRHLYTTYADHFDVCLRVTTVCTASDETCKRVEAHCTKPVAGFTADKTEGVAPLNVRITDTSRQTPETATTWMYTTEGATFSSERNTFYTFSDPGDYTVSQTVKKNCHPDSDSHSIRITVREPLKVYTVMNLSVPATTPTIAIIGMYLTISNASSAVNGTAAATTTTSAAQVTTTPPIPAATIVAAVPGTADPASSTPAAPGTGSLSVTSDPAGAEVYVDDVLRGASPVTVPGLSAGSHTLRLEREGFERMIVPVDISAGRTTGYSTSLVPEAGSPKTPLCAATVVVALVAGGGFRYIKNRKTP